MGAAVVELAVLRVRSVVALLVAATVMPAVWAEAPGIGDSASGAVPAPSTAQVVRSAFTSAVLRREPVDSILNLGNDESHVYYFTELRGLAGTRVIHRWEYGGEIMAEVEFAVKGWRWRVWSRKSLMPEWTGEWTVSVLDSHGRVLVRDRLRYNPAAARLRPATGDAVLVASPAAR